jgi:GNAT superfamily N-acetyltransferase
MKSVEVRAYTAADGTAVYELWMRSLGRDWPLDRAHFAAVVNDGFVAVSGESVTGVAAIARQNEKGSLRLLAVDPDLRRRGIGTQLHEAALGELARQGAMRVELGGTPDPYLWPGLPAERDEARRVFEHWAWQFGDPCWDLLRTLSDFERPPGIAETTGFAYRSATEADRANLMAFEAANFPEWTHYFANEGLDSAVVAVDDRGAIVGSLLATDQHRPQLWRRLLGEDSGSIGAVGVAESVCDRGVGTAMLAHACECLRDRGVGNCHVSWTTLLSFYGRLGFQPWRRYETASRDL